MAQPPPPIPTGRPLASRYKALGEEVAAGGRIRDVQTILGHCECVATVSLCANSFLPVGVLYWYYLPVSQEVCCRQFPVLSSILCFGNG